MNVILAEFNSLLELAFGMNGLLYFTEISGYARKTAEKRRDKLYELIELGKAKGLKETNLQFPYGIVAKSFFEHGHNLLRTLSLCLSAACIIMLLASSIYPQMTVDLGPLIVFVLFAFSAVPFFSLMSIRRDKRLVDSYERHIKSMIVLIANGHESDEVFSRAVDMSRSYSVVPGFYWRRTKKVLSRFIAGAKKRIAAMMDKFSK